MQLGVDGVFVGSGIFKSSCPTKRAHAMAQAVTHYNEPAVLAQLSEDLGEAMFGISPSDRLGERRREGPIGKEMKIWDAALNSKTTPSKVNS